MFCLGYGGCIFCIGKKRIVKGFVRGVIMCLWVLNMNSFSVWIMEVVFVEEV